MRADMVVGLALATAITTGGGTTGGAGGRQPLFGAAAGATRACRYVPGGSVTASMVGQFVGRDGSTEFRIEPEDIGGSQQVPLVVLAGPDTVSYGEILAGVLQLAGRATIIGAPTLGNVEQLRRFDLPDSWRAWIRGRRVRADG